jgi:hypothetical protein
MDIRKQLPNMTIFPCFAPLLNRARPTLSHRKQKQTAPNGSLQDYISCDGTGLALPHSRRRRTVKRRNKTRGGAFAMLIRW